MHPSLPCLETLLLKLEGVGREPHKLLGPLWIKVLCLQWKDITTLGILKRGTDMNSAWGFRRKGVPGRQAYCLLPKHGPGAIIAYICRQPGSCTILAALTFRSWLLPWRMTAPASWADGLFPSPWRSKAKLCIGCYMTYLHSNSGLTWTYSYSSGPVVCGT